MSGRGPTDDPTTRELREQLTAAEHGEAAPWEHGGARPRWTAPAIGLLAGSWVLSTALLAFPWGLVASLAHTAAVLGLWFHYWGAAGSFPRGRTPQRLVAALYGVVFGGAALGLSAWALVGLTGLAPAWVVAPVAAVAAWALFTWFDRAYAAAERAA